MRFQDTNDSSILQVLIKIMKEPAITDFIKSHQLDLYIKKMNTAQLMILLIYGIISQAKGLLDISGSLKNDAFSTQLRLESISSSQLSRRIGKLPLDLAWALFNLVKIEARKNVKGNARTLHIIDSTTITMCLRRYQWATFRNDKGGVKLHLRIVYKDKHAYPDHATFTNALAADKTQMNELIVDETSAINVYDRGYVDYKKLNDFCHTGVLFTSRLKGNAVFQVCDERAVDPNGSVSRDCNIILGQGATRVQGILRMIEALDLQGEPVVITSNAHHLTQVCGFWSKISAANRCKWLNNGIEVLKIEKT